jgi:hypothetical protein
VEEGSVKVVLRGSDPEGGLLTFLVVTNPVKGTLTGTAPNLTYTPFADQTGVDTFFFQVSDGDLESAPASVTINISGVNDPPTISAIPDQAIRKNGGTGPLPFTVSDVDDSVGSLRITSATGDGSIVPTNRIALGGSGASRFVSVTPNTGSTGAVQITLTVSDGKSNGRTSFRVTITNSPPLAGNDLLAVEGASLDISASTLLQNDSDADGDPISLVSVSGKSTANGVVMQIGNLIHYTSPAGFSGIDSFSYTIQDSSGAAATAIVAIRVSGPRVTTIQHQQDGSILLSFVGPANRSCQVLASEDTRTWTVVGSATSGSSGSGQFVDRPALTNQFRLYRVEWP